MPRWVCDAGARVPSMLAVKRLKIPRKHAPSLFVAFPIPSMKSSRSFIIACLVWDVSIPGFFNRD